jgi:PIN domain nuclease of toxin-antitoxin system
LPLDRLETLLHRDPFDRLLIAQARHECLTLVTRDSEHPQLSRRHALG